MTAFDLMYAYFVVIQTMYDIKYIALLLKIMLAKKDHPSSK